MSESTLTAAFKDLTGRVGFFLGFGRGLDNGETEWTDEQQASIDECVKSGLRMFYYCGHDWSFLRPVATLTLAATERTVQLPDDFGGTEGRITVREGTSGTQWWPIDFTSIGMIYSREGQLPDTSGRPLMCCEEPLKGTTATQSNRSQLRFWPIADAAYTIQFQYYINPDYLSGAFPYAYGGPEHSECLLEACKAAAERDLDDAESVHKKAFMEMLQVSMKLDRRHKEQWLGYNRDNSDAVHAYDRRNWHGWGPPISFNGTVYP